MMDREPESRSKYYKPVQRISQACQSCRKRKARCSGERPKCNNCLKFSRECFYHRVPKTPRSPSSNNSQPETKPTTSHAPDEMIRRLNSTVENLSDRLDNIERLLQHQNDLVSRLLSSTQNGDHNTSLSQPPQLPSTNSNVAQTPPTSLGSVRSEDAPPDACPAHVILETVDVFFIHCHNQPYCFFHELSFRQRLANGDIPNYLLYAVLATAIRFSDNPYFKNKDEAAEIYANYSWNSIMSNCFSVDRVGDIQIVQTVTLLAVFDFTAGKSRHGSAWVKIGLSVRIAQDLKLMMESGIHLSNVEQEERRRVFWSVYLLDRLVSCGRARPPAILDASCQLQLPCDEMTWRNGSRRPRTLTLDEISRHVSLNTTEQQQQQQSSPTGNVIAAAYTLSRAAQYMVQDINNVRNNDYNPDSPPWDSKSEFASILSDLVYLESLLEISKSPTETISQWTMLTANGKRLLDQQRVGPVIFGRALYHLCYCLLHHPFLLRKRLSCSLTSTSSTRPYHEKSHAAASNFLSRAFDTGWEHSKAVINLLQDMRSVGAIAHTSYYGYCAMVSGSIAALQLNHASMSRRAEGELILQNSIDFLVDISRYWKNVSCMELALNRFSEDIHRFRELISDSPVIEPLSADDCETLSALVDYSTISNTANDVNNDSKHSSHLLSDIHTSWTDLFEGIVDDADFAVPDMELPVDFGAAPGYTSTMSA